MGHVAPVVGLDVAVGVSDNVACCFGRGYAVVKHVPPALVNEVGISETKVGDKNAVNCGMPLREVHGVSKMV